MDQERVTRVLHRTRNVIGDSVRSYQCSQIMDRGLLRIVNENLNRIATHISQDTFNSLSESISDLIYIESSTATSDHVNNQNYVAPRVRANGRGRPSLKITEEQLRLFQEEGFSARDIAKMMGCSQASIYQRLYRFNLPMRSRYSRISDEQLHAHIDEIHKEHPNAADAIIFKINGYCCMHRVRTTLNQIDPVGTASRWSNSIKRRVYKVQMPNSLWHMDAHLKLSRWGFVIHGCIDGYSRMIVYLKCECSIQAEPVLNFFTEAVENFGLPSRVRSDRGYENILVAVLMNTVRGLNRGSHITGKSIHNQRIERLWLDVYKEVCDSISRDLYMLESERILHPDNLIHKFCVQYLYKDIINQKLTSFQLGWNSHKLRTEHSKTPRQLWLSGTLLHHSSTSTAPTDIFGNNETLHQRLTESFISMGVNLNDMAINEGNANFEATNSSFKVDLNLNEEQYLILSNIKKSVGTTVREKYVQCVNYLSMQH